MTWNSGDILGWDTQTQGQPQARLWKRLRVSGRHHSWTPTLAFQHFFLPQAPGILLGFSKSPLPAPDTHLVTQMLLRVDATPEVFAFGKPVGSGWGRAKGTRFLRGSLTNQQSGPSTSTVTLLLEQTDPSCQQAHTPYFVHSWQICVEWMKRLPVHFPCQA